MGSRPSEARVLSAALLLGASPAIAQTPTARVTIHGDDPRLQIMLHPADASVEDNRPLARCEGSCELRVPKGSYTLQVAGLPGSDIRTSDRGVDLFGDADVLVGAPHQSARKSGLAWGIVGAIVAPNAFGGLLFSSAYLIAPCSFGGDCPLSSGTKTALWTAAIGSGVLLVGGVTAAVLGWRAFAMNNGPQIRITSTSPPWDAGRL